MAANGVKGEGPETAPNRYALASELASRPPDKRPVIMTTNMPQSRELTLPGRAPDGGHLRLHCLDWGGDGTPLLLLHGLSSSARIWDLMAPHLAQHFHTTALDQRGHGLSDCPDDAYSFAEVTADVEGVIDALGLVRPIIVGHSWGGNVAVHFAADYADHVRGIVLVDGGFTSIAQGVGWEQAEKMMVPPDIDGVDVERFIAMASSWPHVKDVWSPQLQEMILSNFEVRDARIYRRLTIPNHMKIAKAIYDQGLASLFPRVRCPALLVPALREPSSDQEKAWQGYRERGIEQAVRLLPNARVQPMENTPHDVPIYRPRELADAIIEFAQGLS